MRHIGAVVGAAVLVLAACGGDEEVSEEDYVEAYVDWARVELDVGSSAEQEERLRCFAQADVDAIGLERLREEGVTPEEFAEDIEVEIDDAEPLDRAVEECDAAGFVVEVTTRPARSAVSEEERRCVADALRADPAFVDQWHTWIAGDAEDIPAQVGAFVACPDALAGVVTAGLTQDATSPDFVLPSPEEVACIDTVVRADPLRFSTAFFGDGDLAATYGDLGRACAGVGPAG